MNKKLSPTGPRKPMRPVLQHPGKRSSTPPLKKPVYPESKKTNNTSPSGESSINSSTDSLIDSTPKIAPRKVKESEIPPSELPKPVHCPPPPEVAKDSIKSKFAFFRKGSGDKEKDKHDKGKKDGDSHTPKSMPKFSKEGGAKVGAGLAGAKPVLPPPGSRPVLPKQSPSSIISDPKQLPSRTALHHVSMETKDKPSDDKPIAKDTVVRLAQGLENSVKALNKTKNKQSSHFMNLSEQVQAFHNACSNYVDSLPPHGKFHFRELLSNLQKLAEKLKTSSGGSSKEKRSNSAGVAEIYKRY